MYMEFDKLSPESRIWVFQADRALSDDEKEYIHEKTTVFLEGWKSHGKPLEAGMEIRHDQFIVIGANDTGVEIGGCTQDKLMRFMRKMSEELSTDLLDKSKIAILDDVMIKLIDFSEVRDLIKNAAISPDTFVFNNAILHKKDLDTQWFLPARESWLKRYFQA